MTETKAIHPEGRQVTSMSPYDKKLVEVSHLLEMLLSVAPEGDRSDLLLASGIVAELVRKKAKRDA